MSYRIPWAQPYIGEEEIEAATATLRARHLSMGTEVRLFEHEVAALCERRHAVAVANGTVALDLALQLVGIQPGEEVLVPALSDVDAANCILRAGAKPVFCEVDPVTLNLDPADAARRVTGRTRALLAADYCGSSLEHYALEDLCLENDLAFVLDGAQSLGTLHRGRPALSFGHVATTSFETSGAFACGEGGMVLCDDAQMAERCRRLRGYGEAGPDHVDEVLVANHRMTELAAAIGRVQLTRAPEVLARRREIIARYDALLGDHPMITPVGHLPGTMPAGFSYAVRVPDRDVVAATLDLAGIQTRSLYPVPAYRQAAPEYAPYAAQRRPIAEDASASVLNLPVFFELTDSDVDEVAAAVLAAIEQPAKLAQAA